MKGADPFSIVAVSKPIFLHLVGQFFEGIYQMLKPVLDKLFNKGFINCFIGKVFPYLAKHNSTNGKSITEKGGEKQGTEVGCMVWCACKI